MKRFIRTHCDDYLQDPNITSIGIGRRKGEAKGELVLQFAVESTRPEGLESASAKTIPREIDFEGAKIPTDVVQRSFRPSYLMVARQELEKEPRKQRLDTLVPGISIGNRRTTDAGTLGTLVLDTRSGQPAILSNWHVLHTTTGEIGDEVVQPGPFDDNRTDQNVIGRVIRSHLGAAGDCAICSIESRNTESQIMGLKTAVLRIGKAQLDDRVVKSGRTTGVTFGVVTRVETITRMNYGSGVIENIGGFEIGIDSRHLPPDGEISKGGDSGSCWMALDDKGKPTDVMLGLHFAGEAEDSDAEFALACNAHSVCEKLEIMPLPESGGMAPGEGEAARSDLRNGFDSGFLKFPVPPIRLTDAMTADLAMLDGRREIPYCHFSVWLSKSRKFPRVVAWNIDGGKIRKIDRIGYSLYQRRARRPRRVPDRRRTVRQQSARPRPSRPPRGSVLGHGR